MHADDGDTRRDDENTTRGLKDGDDAEYSEHARDQVGDVKERM